MSQIAEAGFRYTELGPYGYYPPDALLLNHELRQRNLSMVAGFIFEPLHEPELGTRILEIAEQICTLLSKLGARYLVLIDHTSADRMSTAGIKAAAVPLDPKHLEFMIDLIRRLAVIARRHSVMPVLHQHAGSYLEFEEEIEHVLSKLDPEQVGICIDTGHMAYAGIDAVSFYQRHHKRVRYFHFKDIDASVSKEVIEGRIPFLNAVSRNIFCPLGHGVTDWQALRQALCEHRFAGYATIEQDVDPSSSYDPVRDARSSLEYLHSIGF